VYTCRTLAQLGVQRTLFIHFVAMAHQTETVEIIPGEMVIYRRSDHKAGSWQVRLKVKEIGIRYLRKTLKTQSEGDARLYALKFYGEITGLQRRGIAVVAKQFQKLIDEVIIDEKLRVAQAAISLARFRNMERILNGYISEFFGKRQIGSITQTDIDKFWYWRKTYWTEGPGKAKRKPRNYALVPKQISLLNEAQALQKVFNKGASQGYIDLARSPNIYRGARPKHGEGISRSSFTPEEYRALVDYWGKWVELAPDAHTQRSRQNTRDLIVITANSGIRPPGELLKVRYSALRKVGDHHSLYVSGKMGPRQVTLHDEAVAAIMTRKVLTGASDDDLIFTSSIGESVQSFTTGFNASLKKLGLKLDQFNIRRTLYSLRHSYATWRLEEGLSVYTIAENMGTSVEMIDRHYGHIRKPQAAAHLTGPDRERLRTQQEKAWQDLEKMAKDARNPKKS
jgi:integrase